MKLRTFIHTGLFEKMQRQNSTIQLLLVEDNPLDARQFKTSVCGNRVVVTVAENGPAALARVFRRGEYANSPVFDLVVADLNVPLLDGHGVLNVIKSSCETRHIPVIVWTGSENPSDLRKAFELGCCAYMIKPMDLDECNALLCSFADFWLPLIGDN